MVIVGCFVKRLKCILKVLQTLIHSYQDSTQIEAHLIGTGPNRAGCEQLVIQASLADRILLHPHVPLEQCRHYYNVARRSF